MAGFQSAVQVLVPGNMHADPGPALKHQNGKQQLLMLLVTRESKAVAEITTQSYLLPSAPYSPSTISFEGEKCEIYPLAVPYRK